MTVIDDTNVVILGTGSHARTLWNLTGQKYKMTGQKSRIPADTYVIIGVGNLPSVGQPGLAFRRELYDLHRKYVIGYDDPTSVMRGKAVHPSAQVFARAVINTDAVIKHNVIINTGAIIEHDCIIGPHTHVAPGAVLCGNVRVGAMVHIGAGAIVLQNKTIGAGAVIQAGAVVTRDVAAGATYLARGK